MTALPDHVIDDAAAGDRAAQWKVCKSMQGAVKKLATSFCQQRPDIDIDDMIQEGYLCVLRCVAGYVSKDRKAKFSTYAYRAILNTFIRFADRSYRHRIIICGIGKCSIDEEGSVAAEAYGAGLSAALRSIAALDELRAVGFTEDEIYVLIARTGGKPGAVLATFDEIGLLLGIPRKTAQDAYESAMLKAEAVRDDMAVQGGMDYEE